MFLFFALWGCQTKQYNEEVNNLVREGNNLIKQEESVSTEWKTEFITVFTPENRAKFPSNREKLRFHAENQIRLLEQKQVLNNSAVDKFELASQLSNNEKEKRATALFAQSFKKNVEIDQLFKEQMNLVLDDRINDSKTFETQFMDLTQRIEIKGKERDELQTKAKGILERQE